MGDDKMSNRATFRGFVLAASLLLGTTVAARAQKIETGYDKSADFNQYKTYSWVPRTVPATNPVVAAIIVNDIEYELNHKGLHKVDGQADLLVKLYGGAEDVQGGFAAEDPSYAATGGAPLPGANMWGGSLPPTPVPQTMHGSITVDLVDARQQRLVWRATAKGKMDYDKRSKLLDQANKAVSEMFKKYPPAQ